MPRSGFRPGQSRVMAARGFNEAGAIMPRSGPRSGRTSATPKSFNEAGAIMPRSGLRITAI